MAENLLINYAPILVFMAVATFVALAAVALSFLLAKHRPDAQKNAPYECGFPPFGDARMKFDVRF